MNAPKERTLDEQLSALADSAWHIRWDKAEQRDIAAVRRSRSLLGIVTKIGGYDDIMSAMATLKIDEETLEHTRRIIRGHAKTGRGSRIGRA